MKYKSMKPAVRLAAAVLVVSATIAGLAEETTPEMAKKAVENWLGRNPAPVNVKFASTKSHGETETYEADDGRVLFHIVPVNGGGWVVVSGDTRLTPVVAFSAEGRFDPDLRNPFAALLLRDMTARLAALDAVKATQSKGSQTKVANAAEQEWAGLLVDDTLPTDKIQRSESISDVRVAPMVQSKWDQGSWNGYRTFNYYTPNGYLKSSGDVDDYPCGCVATAFAQIMRFWREPSGYVNAGSYWCWVDGDERILTMKGGYYNWEQMPLVKSSCTSSSQREAIGKLTWDIGVASRMEYSWDAGGTFASQTVYALTNRFEYASAKIYHSREAVDNNIATATNDDFKNAILASLDAEMPCVIEVSGTGGHAIVVDGYGYDAFSVVYSHLNCGWDGRYDMWYNLIQEVVSTDSLRFDSLGSVAYNVNPTIAGDVISGRVLSSNGSPLSGVTVTLTPPYGSVLQKNTNDKGIYFFRVSNAGIYGISAASGGLSGNTSVSFTPGINAIVEVTADSGIPHSYGTVGNKWGVDIRLGSSSGPANDNFDSATYISGSSGSITGSNVDATSQSGEPILTFRSEATKTVWWRWTALGSGTAIFNTDGSGFDTVMGIYTGSSLSSLINVSGSPDDDSGNSNNSSRISFQCTAGTTYYICVAGFGRASGDITLNWTAPSGPAPSDAVRVYFNANGGSVSRSYVDAKPGNLWGKMPMPFRSGHVFTGWFTSLSGGTMITASSAVPRSSTTYYARWTPRLSLGAAADTSLALTTDCWCGQGAESHDGTDALRSGIIYDGQSCWLQTTMRGSGVLSFWWKVSCEGAGYDKLSVLVDGIQREVVTGETDWSRVSISITGSGTHTVKWVYRKDGSGTKGQDCGWIDQIAWTAGDTVRVNFNANGGSVSRSYVDAKPGNLWGKMPMPSRSGYVFTGWFTSLSGGTMITASSAVPRSSTTYYAHWTPRLSLGAAADTSLALTTDCWCGQGAESHDGTDALRSGIIYDGQSCWLQTTVRGPGALSFWWKVSCEGGGYDKLSIVIDGVQQAAITGETGWRQVKISITGSGAHTVKWVYRKDGSGTKGQDCGWIDQIAWRGL